MGSEPQLEAEFFRSVLSKNESLNQRLDESRRDIDTWFRSQVMPPSLIALANLEVMLRKRTQLLSELAALDDQFASHIAARRKGTEDETESRRQQ